MDKSLDERLDDIESLVNGFQELCHQTTTGNLPHHITNIEAYGNNIKIVIRMIKRDNSKWVKA